MSNQRASDSVNPADFVQRIRQLGEKRNLAEEAERSRALEEEILQGRSERLARRAEHARSLSKSSEPLTPQSPRSFFEPLGEVSEKQSPDTDMNPHVLGSLNRLTGNLALDEENVSPEPITQPKPRETSTPPVVTGSPTTPSGTALTRGLSWQQRRPNSSSGRRPLSVMAAENNASRSPKASPGPSSPEARDLSRAQIAQSLGAKDPSWFKQTSERETNSPANRSSRGDIFASDTESLSGRRQLPGMAAREASSVDVQKGGNSPTEGGGSRSGSPSRSSSGRDGARWSNHYSTTTSLSGFSGTDHRSPTHSLDRFRIPPPSQSENTSSFDEDDSFNSGKSLAMSPSQERISAIQAERSPSPTKGMGGFVQSAMLKRNDSVNKRWSAHTYTGLSRQNSIIGSNNAIRSNDDDNKTNSTLNRSNSRDLTFNPPSFDRSGSPSRASTSIGTADDFSKTADPGDDVFVKPSLPLSSLHSRSKSSVVSTAAASSAATGAAGAAVSDKDDAVGRSNSRSTSPSKRWSPTKASWLENALKKPAESPKSKAMAPLQQPSWMAEISKTKAQRNSVDMGSAASASASASVLNFQKGGVGDGALADLKLHSKSSPAFPSLDIAEGQRVETETEKKKMDVGAQEHQHEKLKEDTAKLESKKSIAKDPEREIQEYTPPMERDDEASPSAKFDTSKARTLPDLQKSNVSNKPSTATIATAATTTTESRPSPTLHLSRTITSSTSIKPSVAPIPKSTEPNTISNSSDFRSVLKSRQAPSSSPSSNSDKKEFINVIGTLKRTQTKNYVAPDELKDNILRGKAALNVTGGPKKSERKDEFKESILRQKEAMRAKAEVEAKEGGGAAANGLKASKMTKMQEEEVPEALAKRNALGKGGVAGNAASVGAGISVGTSEIGKSSSINGQAEKRFGSGREAPTKIESAEKKDMAVEPKNVLSPTEKQPSPLKSSPSPSKEPPNNSKIPCTPPESKTTLLAGLGDKDCLADNESLPSPSTKATKVRKVAEIEEKPATAGTFRTNISSSRKVDPLENSSPDGMNSVKRSSVEERKEKEGEQKASTLPSASIKVESPGLHGLKSPALEKASAPAGNVPVSSSSGKAVASSPLLSVGSAMPLSGKAVATSPPSSAASGKLADRLNPALAGLIAKGIAHNGAAKSEPLLMRSEATNQSETSTGVGDSRAKELTHMTRGRARGPKRKPPTMTTTTTTTIAQQKHSEEPVTVTSSASVFVENHEKPDPVDDSATTSPKDRGTANSSSFLHSEASITPQSSLDEFQSPEPHMISKEENGSKFPKSTSTPPQTENLTTKSPHHDRDSYPARKSITLSQPPQIPPVFSTEAKAAGRMSSSSSPSRSPSPRSKGSFQVHTPTSPLATQRFISGSEGEEGLGISTMPLSPNLQDHQARQRGSLGFFGALGPNGPRDRDSKGSISSLKDLDGQALRGSVEMPGSPSKTAIAMTGYKIPESPSKSTTSITGQKIPDSASRSTTNMTGYNRSRSTSPTKLREWSAPPQKVDHHNVPSPGPGSPRSREAGDSSNNNGNNIFADYFDVTPVTPAHLLEHIDTQAILTSANPAVQGPKADAHKIRTISKQICEIRGDGKMDALPAQQEHVLYEQEMYVCSHTFASADGIKSTEVYLWAGAGVSESAVEDAQLFAKRVAKENGTKHLAIIRQGKETPNFLQALGGILITLRGTRTESRSRYMLCGRKHLGHVTFDEVDFALGSFCSGFPFLISSGDAAGGGGKLLLWKGAGCNVEELSCARLISMDLGGGGSGGIIGEELCEIDEGQEPQSFFDMFASDASATGTTPATTATAKKMPRSAEYWKLKANNHRYHVRLFRVEQQQHQHQQQSSSQTLSTDTQSQTQSRFQMGSLWPLRRPSWNNSASSSPPGTPNSKVGTPPLPRSPGQRPMSSSSTSSSVPKTSIVEITPFNQSDLEPEDVYVLDAFFEIYIIVGPLSRTQHTAFAIALLFAQDYGILAASLQDRPFVPVSTVVLEGAPRDMKAAFRQWEDRFLPTGALMAGKPRRGRSLRIVGLAAALAATRQD